MTCREVTDFLLDYLEGELSGEVLRVFEAHLAGCEACVAYLASYRRAVRLGASAFRDEAGKAPPELVEAILAAKGGGSIRDGAPAPRAEPKSGASPSRA